MPRRSWSWGWCMGDTTAIEWCDRTFNPWIGCTKVSAACKNCYAEAYDKRWNGGDHWGPEGARRRTSVANWRKPLRWNRLLEGTDRRERVFCASLADVFEDHPELVSWRRDLFQLIGNTPNLDWLLLTKRPENIAGMLPEGWGQGWPNVWLGTTVEDQVRDTERIPHLLQVPAAVRFLSMEPLLGPVNLGLIGTVPRSWGGTGYEIICDRLHWVIAGGESGPGARETRPTWFRNLRDQCHDAGVAFFMKQMSEHGGRDKRDIPDDLLVREFPVSPLTEAA